MISPSSSDRARWPRESGGELSCQISREIEIDENEEDEKARERRMDSSRLVRPSVPGVPGRVKKDDQLKIDAMGGVAWRYSNWPNCRRQGDMGDAERPNVWWSCNPQRHVKAKIKIKMRKKERKHGVVGGGACYEF